MKRSFLLSAFAFCSLALSAQETREITLNEAIALARTQSVDAAVALNELKTAYWEYRTFRADLLPEVNFSGTLPSYGKEITVTLDEIQKGDIVICKPGEKIAVDGEVVEGTTHINESFITGESVPVKREKGSKVIAGSINYEGTIKYKAEKIGKESTVSEIVRLVTQATSTKAPIAKIADTISGYFVPVVLIIAFLAFCTWTSYN